MSTSTNQETVTAESVRDNLRGFLERQTKTTVQDDLDLFASGLVSSLFALELVVHLERSFGTSISGADLKLDNFRTVNSMTDLVLRQGEDADA